MPVVRKLTVVTLVLVTIASVSPRAAPVLDYDFFKARVEPIFLEKRMSHTRCYVCHAESNNAFRLERLPLPAPPSGAMSSRGAISRWPRGW